MSVLELSRWQFGITTVYHFLFVPITIGLGFLVAGFETAWVAFRSRALAAADQVLREAVPDQFRHRRRHRHSAGIPVRHELVRLFAVRGRHLRRAAGDRGTARLLPRVHVPGAMDLRLGPAAPRCTPPAYGSPRSARCCPPTSSWPPTPGCSTRSATIYNPVTHREDTDLLRGGADQPGPARHVPAHHRGLLPGGRGRLSPARAVAPDPAPGRAITASQSAARRSAGRQDRRDHRDRRRGVPRSPATSRARSPPSTSR